MMLSIATLLIATALFQQPTSGDPVAAAEALMSDKKLTISQQFRVIAEDGLGCLDALMSVEDKPDSIFLPQDMRCMEMLGKAKRIAANKRESAVALSLISLQDTIGACHIDLTAHVGNVSECVSTRTRQRKAIIDAAGLTN
jgi:hypothetical protein